MHGIVTPELFDKGYLLTKLLLPPAITKFVNEENWEALDQQIKELAKKDGLIYQALKKYGEFDSIEFIISLRNSDNEWEEDGVWHDDGSRNFAFSLSLTTDKPEGGKLHIRNKKSMETHILETPEYGEMVVFLTGVHGYEHKIHAVTKGQRLIIAGWCS